jgi:hypothetical protein
MNVRFEAEILRDDAASAPRDVVRERVYGGVRVVAEWPADLATPEIRVGVEVSGDLEQSDAPAYAELFFHDVFLILNLSTPCSFAGTVSMTGAELRVRDVTFNARLFQYAKSLGRVGVEQVVGWYDGLGIGTSQIAATGVAAALFQLLHLARAEEDEEQSVLRLAGAAEALDKRDGLRRLFELREEIARGRVPAIHPMHDDGLDPRVEDITAEWIDVVDEAAGVVIGALQQSAAAHRGA